MKCRTCKYYHAVASQCRRNENPHGEYPKVNPERGRNCKDHAFINGSFPSDEEPKSDLNHMWEDEFKESEPIKKKPSTKTKKKRSKNE